MTSVGLRPRIPAECACIVYEDDPLSTGILTVNLDQASAAALEYPQEASNVGPGLDLSSVLVKMRTCAEHRVCGDKRRVCQVKPDENSDG